MKPNVPLDENGPDGAGGQMEEFCLRLALFVFSNTISKVVANSVSWRIR